MKIALAQINNTVSDFIGNVEIIKTQTIEARANGADIIVFPELAVCGYPCRDLVELTEFRHKNSEAVQSLIKFSENMDILMIFGALGETIGGSITNSAYAVYQGMKLRVHDKMLLPTYDVFDEWRNFVAGDLALGFTYKGRRLGVCICEDMWANPTFKQKYGIVDKYKVNPVGLLAGEGCETIINLSASPFTRQKLEVRRDLLKITATEYKVNVVYCNMVGGNDSLIFDGNSMAVNSRGDIITRGPSFATGLLYADFEANEGTFNVQYEDEKTQIWNALVLGVRDYVSKCGFSDVVIGLSGGIDSALVTAIAVEAVGSSHVTCITMPSAYSSEGSVKDSVALAASHNVTLYQVPIQKIKEAYLSSMMNDCMWWNESAKEWMPTGLAIEGLADENLQARIRGGILMAYSNQNRALVLSTGNKSETAVGYCTIYGDMCGGLSVIADVPKTMVYALSRWYNYRSRLLAKKGTATTIPRSIIVKAPSAELAPGQYDQQSLPPYDILDAIIQAYVEDRMSEDEIVVGMPKVERAVIHKILGLIDRAEYKRQQAAPTLKVTSKAWFGRFMPIAKKSLYR